MRYTHGHVKKLNHELRKRLDLLQQAIPCNALKRDDDIVEIDGMAVRLAVDDFKAILAETRRLK